MEAIIIIMSLVISAIYMGFIALKGETEGSVALVLFKFIPMAVAIGCIYSLYVIFTI